MSDRRLRELERACRAEPCPENLAKLDRCLGGRIKRDRVLGLLNRLRWRIQARAVGFQQRRLAAYAVRLAAPNRCLVRSLWESDVPGHRRIAAILGPDDCFNEAATHVHGIRACRDCADELSDHVTRGGADAEAASDLEEEWAEIGFEDDLLETGLEDQNGDIYEPEDWT